MSELPSTSPKISTNTGLIVATTGMAIAAIWLCLVKISPPQVPAESVVIPSPSPTASPTPQPSLTATPTPPPKPTKVPAAQTDSAAGDQKNCTALRNGSFSTITVELQPRSGQMTGDTVVRLKQGGNCPGNSTSEQWLSSGERQKTFNQVEAGTYLIELANGNYQGVVRKTVTVEGGRQYLFTVPIED